MAERILEALQKKIMDRLHFYEDIGIRQFYRDRIAELRDSLPPVALSSLPDITGEMPLPKPVRKPELPKAALVTAAVAPKISPLPLPVAAGPSLFESIDKIADDTLLKIREDLGECTRCKLHGTRHTIVFGDGNPKAELVFVGEGPGADEDAQGLPFVGRAGQFGLADDGDLGPLPQLMAMQYQLVADRAIVGQRLRAVERGFTEFYWQCLLAAAFFICLAIPSSRDRAELWLHAVGAGAALLILWRALW